MKIDVDRGGRPYEFVSFSDVDCIKGLIKYRSKFVPFYGFEHGTVSTVEKHYDQAGICEDVNAELITIYTTLDDYLSKAELNWKQKYIIEHIMLGNTEADLAKFFKTDIKNMFSVVDTVANRIKMLNDNSWKYNDIFFNKIKAKFEYKKCCKCGDVLPANRDFFGRDTRNSDNLKGTCKKCDKRRANEENK